MARFLYRPQDTAGVSDNTGKPGASANRKHMLGHRAGKGRERKKERRGREGRERFTRRRYPRALTVAVGPRDSVQPSRCHRHTLWPLADRKETTQRKRNEKCRPQPAFVFVPSSGTPLSAHQTCFFFSLITDDFLSTMSQLAIRFQRRKTIVYSIRGNPEIEQ